MPSYAILGATGNVGGSILKILLQDNENTIHAYCRSRNKLIELHPAIADDKRVRVFEGSLQDVDLLANCLRGTSAVFLAVAATGNQPGCSIAQDTAHSVIAAVEQLRASNTRPPRLIVLSSASTDHRLMSDVPQILRSILYAAFSNIYNDLKAAETYLRSKDDYVSATFVKPGGLSVDTQKGHFLSTEFARTPVSFLDLAAGMVEIASEDREKYDFKSVAVNAVAKDVAFPWQAPLMLLKGLLVNFLPFLYRYIG